VSKRVLTLRIAINSVPPQELSRKAIKSYFKLLFSFLPCLDQISETFRELEGVGQVNRCDDIELLRGFLYPALNKLQAYCINRCDYIGKSIACIFVVDLELNVSRNNNLRHIFEQNGKKYDPGLGR
jgi:hypothetical protein